MMSNESDKCVTSQSVKPIWCGFLSCRRLSLPTSFILREIQGRDARKVNILFLRKDTQGIFSDDLLHRGVICNSAWWICTTGWMMKASLVYLCVTCLNLWVYKRGCHQQVTSHWRAGYSLSNNPRPPLSPWSILGTLQELVDMEEKQGTGLSSAKIIRPAVRDVTRTER